MYVCAGFSQLHAKDSFTKSRYFNSTVETIGLVHRIYQCKPSLTSPLLAASASQQSKLPTSVKPALQQSLNKCESTSQLNINGDISITDSKDVEITVGSLSDITVAGNGSVMKILIPAGGSFTINGIPYTTSPIPGLAIVQNNQPGVRIDSDSSGLDFSYGIYIGKNITLNVQGSIANVSLRSPSETAGSITMSNNAATSSSNNVYGFRNDGTITAAGSIAINDNAATLTGQNSFEAYGVYNFGTITGNGSDSSEYPYASAITMSGNQAISSGFAAYGAYNNGIVTATIGTITIKNNEGTTSASIAIACGVYNNGTITGNGIDSNEYPYASAITIENNQGTNSTSLAGRAYGVYNNDIVTATVGTITIKNNQGTNNASLGSAAYGVNNNAIVTATVGAITMIDNQATGGYVAYGVHNAGGGAITVGTNITMENNQATSSGTALGVLIRNGSTVKTGGSFIITVVTTGPANQNFDSSAVAITNVAGTALPYSGFTVTVNGTVRTTYGAIPAGSVVLNSANRT